MINFLLFTFYFPSSSIFSRNHILFATLFSVISFFSFDNSKASDISLSLKSDFNIIHEIRLELIISGFITVRSQSLIHEIKTIYDL